MTAESEASIHRAVQQITAELSVCVSGVAVESVIEAQTMIAKAARIFVSGAGRSGLCMRAFAMRLMHLGKRVHVVGDTTTPSIGAGDLLIIGSGSGKTASLLVHAERASHRGATLLLISTTEDSPLADLAECCLIIPAPLLKNPAAADRPASVQPMGTLFEQALLIVGDALVLGLMGRLDIDEQQMSARHANLE